MSPCVIFKVKALSKGFYHPFPVAYGYFVENGATLIRHHFIIGHIHQDSETESDTNNGSIKVMLCKGVVAICTAVTGKIIFRIKVFFAIACS